MNEILFYFIFILYFLAYIFNDLKTLAPEGFLKSQCIELCIKDICSVRYSSGHPQVFGILHSPSRDTVQEA